MKSIEFIIEGISIDVNTPEYHIRISPHAFERTLNRREYVDLNKLKRAIWGIGNAREDIEKQGLDNFVVNTDEGISLGCRGSLNPNVIYVNTSYPTRYQQGIWPIVNIKSSNLTPPADFLEQSSKIWLEKMDRPLKHSDPDLVKDFVSKNKLNVDIDRLLGKQNRYN